MTPPVTPPVTPPGPPVTPPVTPPGPPVLLQRIDRALAELREIRAALAGEHDPDALTPERERELAELAAKRAPRLLRGGVRP